MENKQIPDSRITSDKDEPNFPHRALNGRLNSNSFWNPLLTSATWMQVYLGLTKTVVGLVTQGYDVSWVMSYYVQTQSFGGEPQNMTHDSNDSKKLFTGNIDGDGSVTNAFARPIETILIRVEPVDCNGICQLRLEILGCNRPLTLSKVRGKVWRMQRCSLVNFLSIAV
ncbi:lactadherin-like [Amphiura filiformis]|uniref:lactadherin-like n=1 Tax=Amphiura filiformis TaxID=82378 RepID=UPI003B21E841